MTQQDILAMVQGVIPVYALVIGLEMVLSYVHNRHYYTTKDTFTNVYLSTLNFLLDLAMKGGFAWLMFGLFSFGLPSISNPWLYWILLIVLEDFAFYWEHRFDHTIRLFWAVHVTHHSSDKYNLTTGFRSSVFQPLYRFIYFIPLPLLGFRPWDIMFVYAATQIYGILIHTQYINKLGFLEWFMATPSHHRVHHASNTPYLDKNMGMVFIIWDKLFGTFEPEDNSREEMRFGLTKPLDQPHHPVNIVAHEWKSIWRDVRRPLPLKTRLKYLFMPPGWSHDGSSQTSRELQEAYWKQHRKPKRAAADTPR
jgi:sterol desaturase/sphingolipid hydroxylase (fatty acid hydroxylase superfamily)